MHIVHSIIYPFSLVPILFFLSLYLYTYTPFDSLSGLSFFKYGAIKCNQPDDRLTDLLALSYLPILPVSYLNLILFLHTQPGRLKVMDLAAFNKLNPEVYVFCVLAWRRYGLDTYESDDSYEDCGCDGGCGEVSRTLIIQDN